MLLQQAEFVDRDNFGDFLNSRGLHGVGVEVGTHHGIFASRVLSQWDCSMFCCVDPWKKIPGYDAQEVFLPERQATREDDFVIAQQNLAPYKSRVHFLRMVSSQASQSCENNSLDFVYLDGDHSYEGVSYDLSLWYPKLRSGGILAGHDIICPGEPAISNWGVFVQRAVSEFATLRELTVYLVIERLCLPWSYYMVKP